MSKISKKRKTNGRVSATHNKSHSGKRRRLSFSGILKRMISVIFLILIILMINIFGVLFLVCKGPSTKARDLFVSTVTQTSAAGFLAHIFLTDDEVAKILEADESVSETIGVISDTNQITIASDTGSSDNLGESDEENGGITVEDVNGSSYSGKMMIVSDPSRVSIYTLDSYSEDGTGKQLLDIINEEGAVAGINAGGFYDPDGHGKGGLALGPVIKNGTLISNFESDYKTLIGFSTDHKLMVGNISASEAIANGMNEGITFGPILVVNGERVPFTDTAGGLNPRTAIGQTADGSILLLVINGRQPSSLGASFKDLVDVMLEYGAVNAANLDGGSSSLMYYNGEQLNSSASLVGFRPLPDAILVK